MAQQNGAGGKAAIATNPLVRTLWHSVYDQAGRSAEFSFYLGDEAMENGHLAARRSPYLTFTLAGAA